MELNLFLGGINCFVALIMIILFIPLKKGLIQMNIVYGIRFRKSFQSEETWQKINEYGAKRFLLWSIPLFFIGCIAFIIPFDNNIFLIALFSAAPVLIILPPTIESYLYAKKV